MTHELTLANEDKSLLSPSNFEHAYRMAKMISQSSMVPKAYCDKPQDVLIAMEMGRTLNLSPLSAVQNIAVINGKPSLYGDGVLAVCSSHPDFEDIKEEAMRDEKGNLIGYSCTVKRKGRSPVTQVFTTQMANTAGLWGRTGPWKSYPERMLQMRARAFALRDSFADALGGVRIKEETQDYQDNIAPSMKTVAQKKEDILGLIERNKNIIDQNVGAGGCVDVNLETGEIVQ